MTWNSLGKSHMVPGCSISNARNNHWISRSSCKPATSLRLVLRRVSLYSPPAATNWHTSKDTKIRRKSGVPRQDESHHSSPRQPNAIHSISRRGLLIWLGVGNSDFSTSAFQKISMRLVSQSPSQSNPYEIVGFLGLSKRMDSFVPIEEIDPVWPATVETTPPSVAHKDVAGRAFWKTWKRWTPSDVSMTAERQNYVVTRKKLHRNTESTTDPSNWYKTYSNNYGKWTLEHQSLGNQRK